ncbi:UNVERIFIED_CONTAM: hypothetical protein PYX00_004405 [Menopon gallinae]|uniref:Uncharacterized protein n=1 Tax=Menopon gallinae TaxID=328185 RepID=A0AAW2I657_9NEOP
MKWYRKAVVNNFLGQSDFENKNMSKCCLWTCTKITNGTQVTLFKFPERDTDLFYRWADAVGKPLDFFVQCRRYICCLHFEENDFDQTCLMKRKLMPHLNTRLVLKKTAVPSRFLTIEDVKHFLTARKARDDKSPLVPDVYRKYCAYAEDRTDFPKVDTEIGGTGLDEIWNTKDYIKEEVDVCEENDREPSDNCNLGYTATEADILEHRESAKDGNSEDGGGENDQRTGKKFECNHCPASFMWMGELRKHKLICHGGYVCHICKKKLININNLRCHKKKKHGIVNVYECEICGSAFPHGQGLANHGRVHKTSANCQNCNCFGSPTNGIRHNCPEYRDQFGCTACGKFFPTKSGLKSHVSKMHCELSCTVCYLKFSSRSRLRLHLMEHADLVCRECNETFEDVDSLEKHNEKHLRVHCQECNTNFANRRRFNRHVSLLSCKSQNSAPSRVKMMVDT